MDHIYIRFLNFCWGCFLIGSAAYFLWKKGATILSIRQYLAKKGILKVKECDVQALVAALCLEQSQVIHHFAKAKQGSELGKVAGCFFSNFPYVNNDCNFRVAEILAVDIDLDTKRFVKAKMENANLTAI